MPHGGGGGGVKFLRQRGATEEIFKYKVAL